jgi:HJR/Mrr/RecB family endonuclease
MAMAKGRKSKLFNDIVDFFYSVSIFLALWIWEETGNPWFAAFTFGASLGLLFFGIQKYKQRKRRILFESSIDKVDMMSGTVFEEFILEHFKHLGFTGYQVQRTENYGADMLLQKDGIEFAVQTKRWKSNVGIDSIRRIMMAIKHYAADKGIVVTNSSFTQSDYELANTNGVELWDRRKLIEMIDKAKGKETKQNNAEVKLLNEAAITEESI